MRSSPYSRRFPQFNQSALKAALKTANIAYVPLGDNLGARPRDRNCYVDGMARYDLIAATEAFKIGLNRLVQGSEKYQISLMCAEQDPIVCHRAILICRLLRHFYGELILKCQFNKLRNLKLLKLRNPYPSLLINLSLLLIPSTVPLVVLPSK